MGVNVHFQALARHGNVLQYSKCRPERISFKTDRFNGYSRGAYGKKELDFRWRDCFCPGCLPGMGRLDAE